MPCSRSASSPSTSSAKSMSAPVVPCFLESLLQRGELVVEDQLLLIKQPSDQGRLAVVDGAAGEEAQGRESHGTTPKNPSWPGLSRPSTPAPATKGAERNAAPNAQTGALATTWMPGTSPGHDGVGRQPERSVHLKIPLALLLFHRARLVGVDQPPLPLRGGGGFHFGDDLVERLGVGLDSARQRIAAERAKAHLAHLAESRRGSAAGGRRRP